MKSTQSIPSLIKNLSLREKLFALYIIALCNMDYAAFLFQGRRVMYADLIFIFLLSSVILNITRENNWRMALRLLLPFPLLLIFFIPSFYNSASLKSSLAEFGALAYLGLLCAVTAYTAVKAGRRFMVFLYLWVFTASFVALIGLTAFIAALADKNLLYGNTLLFYSKIESVAHHLPRIDSLYENANMFLTYLHTAITFAMVLFLGEDATARRKLILACLLIMLAAAFLTGSRRFTGLLLSLFLTLHWIKRGRMADLVKRLAFISFALFFVVSVITSIWVVFPLKIIKGKDSVMPRLNIDRSYSLHLLPPLVSLEIFKKHPFIGCGLGTYNKKFPENVDWNFLEGSFGFEAYPSYAAQVKDRTLNFDPHSAYLGALAETGLAGFLGLIFFLILYGRMMLVVIRQEGGESARKTVAYCIIAGFLGFILNGLIIDILTMRHFWFLLGTGLGLYYAGENDDA